MLYKFIIHYIILYCIIVDDIILHYSYMYVYIYIYIYIYIYTCTYTYTWSNARARRSGVDRGQHFKEGSFRGRLRKERGEQDTIVKRTPHHPLLEDIISPYTTLVLSLTSIDSRVEEADL